MRGQGNKSDKQLTPTEVLQEKGRIAVRRGGLVRLLVSAGATVACTVVLFGLLFGIAIVYGNSMNPAFRHNDLVLYSRLGHRGGYNAGDVIILRAQAEGLRRYVKRVVAVPGDQVDIVYPGVLVLNGEPISEPYAVGDTMRMEGIEYPLQLGAGEYFVMGDNRENSSDSRSFGAITVGHIDGRVLAVLRAGHP